MGKSIIKLNKVAFFSFTMFYINFREFLKDRWLGPASITELLMWEEQHDLPQNQSAWCKAIGESKFYAARQISFIYMLPMD